MPRSNSNPVVLYGTRSEARKRKSEKIADRRQVDAIARFETARFVAEGLAPLHLSLREKAEMVEAAIEGKLLPWRAPTSHESIRQLEAGWRAGKQSIVDYVCRPPTGRRPKGYDQRLVKNVCDAVKNSTFKSVRGLALRITLEGEALGVDAAAIPKYDAVLAMVSAQGPVANTGARYGSRAAELRAMAHGTLACKQTNAIFTVDETKAPWYERGWDYIIEQFVSVRPTIIVVRDYKSGATVGYHISNPMRRIDSATGRPMCDGYDSADVFAALLAAACPDTSPPATRRFSGYLPSSSLRWDNHSTHAKLGPILRELGRATKVDVTGFFLEPDDDEAGDDTSPAELGIRIPYLRVRFPKSRGDIENTLKFVKNLCIHFDGHVDRIRPLDRLEEDPMDERTRGAASSDFTPRREVLPPSALPTREEQAAKFDALVCYQNERHINRVHHRTALARYHEFMPRVCRKGADILQALPLRTTYVQGNGIVVYDDQKEHRFTNHVAGKFVLELGAQVTYRADPLFRGIWAEIDGTTYFLPRKEEYAQGANRGKLVELNAKGEARAASDSAAESRADAIDSTHGVGAAAAFREVADMKLQLASEVAKAVAAADRADRTVRDLADVVRNLRGTNPGLDTSVSSPATRRGKARGSRKARAGGKRSAQGATYDAANPDTRVNPDATWTGAPSGTSRSGTTNTPPTTNSPSVQRADPNTTEPELPDGFDPNFDPRISRADYKRERDVS